MHHATMSEAIGITPKQERNGELSAQMSLFNCRSLVDIVMPESVCCPVKPSILSNVTMSEDIPTTQNGRHLL
eukprot:6466897-Amphidinium_carterae.1